MNYDELEKLILDAKEGDGQAFGALFERYWSLAYYSCYKQLKNEKDAEDAAQEVFIALQRRLPNLKYPEFFAKSVKWLAAEVSRDYAERKKRRADLAGVVNLEEVEEVLPEEKEEFLPAELLERKELRQELLRMVDNLPEKQREAIVLFYFNELSQPEIAKLTRSHPNTVSNRLFHAKRALKAQIGLTLKKGEMGAMTAMPVLTQVFHEEMTAMATSQVKESIWLGISSKLGTAVRPALASTPETEHHSELTDSNSLPNSSNLLGKMIDSASWLRLMAGGAAMTTATCAAVVGINLYQDFNPFSYAEAPGVTSAAVEHAFAPADDDILTALKQINSTEKFQAFLTHYEVEDQNGTVTGEGLAYMVYRKEWDDLEIHLGYALKEDEFKLAYTVRGIAAERDEPVLPTDPEHWVLENLK